MGTKRNVDMSSTEVKVKKVKAVEPKTIEGEKDAETKKKAVRITKRVRGKKYQATRAQVDKTKQYDPFAAIELIKKLSYTKFDSAITAHAVVKEAGQSVTLAFPHPTGQTQRIAIMSDDLLKQIEAGKLDFDVLLSTAQYMPQLAKHAKVLGPKGLMPNPKNGTLSDNPETKKKELEGGQITFKAEKKAPLMHIILGKTDMETKQLVENLQTFISSLKDKLFSLSLSATMSPGVKVVIQ